MCQLLETIKIKNNSLCNLSYHNERVNNSRRQLFGIAENWLLQNIISLDGISFNQMYKCRFVYGKNIGPVEIIPYFLPKIKSLRIIEDNEIEYSFKYSNRSNLEKVKLQSDGADDVLIVKNGNITDITFANIVFFDGNKWITPSTPLLNGIKRQYYLDQGIISEADITVKDLKFFKKARIINAMIDLNESYDIELSNIF